MQGKGLLATEGPVSLPLVATDGCVPCVDSVFLEFEDARGGLYLLEELDAGNDYGVVLTQPGGLLRYRLGDRVRVVGRYRDAPLLDFVGRDGAVSDLVGEKLDEVFVAGVLAGVLPPEAFRCLLPRVPDGGPPGYWLLTDVETTRLAEQVEAGLMTAFRYREARLLGQLLAVSVRVEPDMRQRFHDALVATGMKAGDIKETPLLRSTARAGQLLECLGQRESR